MRIHKILGVFFVLLMSTHCSDNSETVDMKNLNGIWPKKAEQKFDFVIADAEAPKNIIFVVRNNNQYPYSNIRFIVNFKNPDSKTAEVDTLNYILAKPNGEWLGTGFGETKETLFQYRTNYKFPKKGTYEVGVMQAMRNDNLPGIEDLGIKVETAKP